MAIPSAINDVSGPGIMICRKTVRLPKQNVGPAFCRRQHPMTSVFIRFKSKKDYTFSPRVKYKDPTYGYTAEKDVIENYLKSIGVY